MIAISAGMEKSGSAYLFNLINEMFVSAGNHDVREIKQNFHLQSMLELKNCNIRELTWRKLATLLKLHCLGKSFVVKTHHPPTMVTGFLVKLSIIRVVYIYRDPRDVILSAIDHGKFHHEKGEFGEYFARFVTVENSISIIKDYFKIWEEWMKFPKVLAVRYEDLIEDTLAVLNKVAIHLNLAIDKADILKIINNYSIENIKKKRLPVHFNKGKPERYKSEMSPKQQSICIEHFGAVLKEMGFLIEN